MPGADEAEQARLAYVRSDNDRHLTADIFHDSFRQEKDELDREKVSVEAEAKRVTETLVRLAKDRALFEVCNECVTSKHFGSSVLWLQIERDGFFEERRKFEMEKVMLEPPRLDDALPSRASDAGSDTRSNTSREPPRTPEKRNDNASYETVDEDSSSSHASSSLLGDKNKVSPVKINTRPAVSSPLASSTTARHLATSRTRSPMHRRRTIKGPSTPLARFVSHKIVAEKLASAKKSKGPQAASVQDLEQEAAGSTTARPVSRVATAKAPRSTTLTAPTSSSALRSTTKANERLTSSQARVSKSSTTRNPLESAKSSSSTETEQSRVNAMRRGLPVASSATHQTGSSASSSAGKTPSTLKTVRKLEVGQAAGMGPRNVALQTGRSW